MNKTFKFEIKEMGEQGTFVGLASVYGNVDLGKDVVLPGAFTKTISEKNGEVPILWQHDSREPIGMGKLADSPEGLIVRGDLALESPTAAKAYALIKKGILKGLSIGYDTVREEVKGAIRHLTELKLWEVSLVTFPMNELANVLTVKSDDKLIELAERVASLEALVARYAAKFAPDALLAAQQHEVTPENFHLTSDRITKLLRGEL